MRPQGSHGYFDKMTTVTEDPLGVMVLDMVQEMGYMWIYLDIGGSFQEGKAHLKVTFADKNGVMLGHNDDLGVDGAYDQEMDNEGNMLVFFRMNVQDCAYNMTIEVLDLEGNAVVTHELARESDKLPNPEDEEEGMD